MEHSSFNRHQHEARVSCHKRWWWCACGMGLLLHCHDEEPDDDKDGCGGTRTRTPGTRNDNSGENKNENENETVQTPTWEWGRRRWAGWLRTARGPPGVGCAHADNRWVLYFVSLSEHPRRRCTPFLLQPPPPATTFCFPNMDHPTRPPTPRFDRERCGGHGWIAGRNDPLSNA